MEQRWGIGTHTGRKRCKETPGYKNSDSQGLGVDAGAGWAKGNGGCCFFWGRRKTYLALWVFFAGEKSAKISQADNDYSTNDENMMVVGEDEALAYNLKFEHSCITNSIVESGCTTKRMIDCYSSDLWVASTQWKQDVGKIWTLGRGQSLNKDTRTWHHSVHDVNCVEQKKETNEINKTGVVFCGRKNELIKNQQLNKKICVPTTKICRYLWFTLSGRQTFPKSDLYSEWGGGAEQIGDFLGLAVQRGAVNGGALYCVFKLPGYSETIIMFLGAEGLIWCCRLTGGNCYFLKAESSTNDEHMMVVGQNVGVL